MPHHFAESGAPAAGMPYAKRNDPFARMEVELSRAETLAYDTHLEADKIVREEHMKAEHLTWNARSTANKVIGESSDRMPGAGRPGQGRCPGTA